MSAPWAAKGMTSQGGGRKSHDLWQTVQTAVRNKSYTLFDAEAGEEIDLSFHSLPESEQEVRVAEIKGLLQVRDVVGARAVLNRLRGRAAVHLSMKAAMFGFLVNLLVVLIAPLRLAFGEMTIVFAVAVDVCVFALYALMWRLGERLVSRQRDRSCARY